MIYNDIQKMKLKSVADRPLLSLIMSEICVDGKPMDDEFSIKRLSQMKKNSIKSYELYVENGATKNAEEELEYLELINMFLPKEVTIDQIEEELEILELPRSMKSMGPLMKALKSKYPVVDGNIVKSVLTSV